MNCWQRVSLYSHSQLIWARADVFGLFSNNVGPFSLNLVLTARCSHLMWSRNDGCFRVGSFTFSGRYTYNRAQQASEGLFWIERTGRHPTSLLGITLGIDHVWDLEPMSASKPD